MLQNALLFLARFAVGKKLVALVAKPAELARGKRTELILALQALLWTLKQFGVLDGALAEAADVLAVALLGALPVTLADKAKNTQTLVEGLLKK